MQAMTNTEFFKVLAPRVCCSCHEEIAELADCYRTVCEKCDGSVFYPLSPLGQVPATGPLA